MTTPAATPPGPAAEVREAPPWHTLPAAEAAQLVGTSLEDGLSSAEAARRLGRYGPNALAEAPPRPLWRMVAGQFADFMIGILAAAALVSGLVGDWHDSIAIAVIVVLNAVIGAVQEFRAERAMAALRRLASGAAQVVRDGHRATVPAHELVPGDVILIEAGSVVPADVRLAEAARLRIDESLLTGESVAVEKRAGPLEPVAVPVAERTPMAWRGTTVTYGRGRGVVVATGMQTEIGRIAALLAGDGDAQTPLQKRLAAFGRRLALAVLAICAVIFAAGLARGEPVVLIFLTAVSLAVAAIPEALPAVVTILLALGARRMVARNALIRRLPAVETLGSVTYICSDKTGTLTQNRMRVEAVWLEGALHAAGLPPPGAGSRDRLFRALALDNDAVLEADGTASGDATEVALLLAAHEAGFDRAALEQRLPRIAELPFDADRKRMTTLHALPGEAVIACTKGAPESVVPRCDHTYRDGRVVPLDRAAALAIAEAMAADGLRVLAIAERDWPALPEPLEADDAERAMTLLGFVGLIDPPRDEAGQAVALCKSAGIVPVMITGDHPATARAIARRLGILGEGGRVMTGAELAALDDAALAGQVRDLRVYARVDPAQKIRIVSALQGHGEFVAMTGDGVNDAPALERADIGVAMGRGGTDVAREASGLVLLDDNFATIVSAVHEGRRIFDNIRKFIRYAMAGNSAEIWVIFLAPFLGLPIPLLPIHILWVNLVTDGLPGLALAAEPAERGVMQRAPRAPGESVFAGGMWQHIVWVGLVMAAMCLLVQGWAYRTGDAHWQSMVFTVLTLSQMAHVLAIRSERDSLFAQGLASNRPLAGAVLLTFALQMAVLYVPPLQDVFRTQALSLAELGVCVAASSVVFFAVEAEKWLVRRGLLYAPRPAA